MKDGETAQWLLSEEEYDLLILDWMLPRVSGLSLCQHYRASGKAAPVLMITAKDTTPDKVTGLDAGADDYLVKPIDIVEFMARVRALRRRSPLWQGDANAQVGLLLAANHPQIQPSLENIIDSSKSMNTLVSNLLLLARHQGRLAPGLRLESQSSWVVIQVVDTGIGIPQADLPYVFDRFYRSDRNIH